MQAANPADACVVDEHVEASVRPQCSRDERACLTIPADVEVPDVHVGRSSLSAPLGHRIESVHAAGAEVELCAALGEGDGGGRSDAAGGPGDHHHRSLQPHAQTLAPVGPRIAGVRALTYQASGDVKVIDVPKPAIKGSGEALLKGTLGPVCGAALPIFHPPPPINNRAYPAPTSLSAA